MPKYQTSFDIPATANRVWQVLTALDRYPEWNPQISTISGTIAPGAKVDLRLTMPDRPAMNVSARIERAEPDRLLTWRGHVLAPWFFQGFRRFEIEPIDAGRVRFTHVEDITGLFAPVFALVMGGAAGRSHQALNEALRARSESSTVQE